MGRCHWSFMSSDDAETDYEFSASSQSQNLPMSETYGVFPLLSPYMIIGAKPLTPGHGTGPSDTIASPDSLLESTDTIAGDSAASAPVRRFAVAVAPLYIKSVDEERSPTDKLLLDLDTKDLYTSNDTTALQTNFGTAWEKPSEITPDPAACEDKYGESDGVFSSPVPIRGAPVKFRKVYFKGATAGCDEPKIGGYYAHFLCSEPILNTDTCETTCQNPRNANFNYMDGVDKTWAEVDMGGGCTTSYSTIAGTGYINDGAPDTQYYETGFGEIVNNEWATFDLSGECSNILIFSGNCNSVSSVEQIKFTDESYDVVTGRYATVVKLFADYVKTGISLCQPDGTVVSGNILFQPCGGDGQPLCVTGGGDDE